MTSVCVYQASQSRQSIQLAKTFYTFSPYVMRGKGVKAFLQLVLG